VRDAAPIGRWRQPGSGPVLAAHAAGVRQALERTASEDETRKTQKDLDRMALEKTR